jgi:hypothetical protein
MIRLPSAETQLRAAKSDLKRERMTANELQSEARAWKRRSDHYEVILQAIAKGMYPGEQAALAAQHALVKP